MLVSAMVQMNVRLLTEEKRMRALLQGLRLIARSSRLDRGCLRSGIFEDASDSALVHYIEEWESAEEMERHIRSERFTRLLALAEEVLASPEFEFRFISEVRGLEYVAAQRSCPALPEIL